MTNPQDPSQWPGQPQPPGRPPGGAVPPPAPPPSEPSYGYEPPPAGGPVPPPAPPPDQPAYGAPPAPGYGQPPGAAGYPQPRYGPPGEPPPPKKKNRGCLIAALIVGGIVILGAVAIIVVAVIVGNAVTGPANATNSYLKAIKSNNIDAAFNGLCTEQQTPEVRTQLQQLTQYHGGLSKYYVVSSNIQNSTGNAAGTATFNDGSSGTVRTTVSKQGGTWKVCGVELHSNADTGGTGSDSSDTTDTTG